MSLRLTFLGGQVRDLLCALATGIAAAIAACYGFADDYGTFWKSYTETLSTAWRVFAAWLPIMGVILSFLVSNADKKFAKAAGKAGLLQRLIDNVAFCGCCIIAATIVLFIHAAMPEPPIFWTFICTAVAGTTISIFAIVSWHIFTFAKYIATTEANTKDKDR